MSGTIRICRTFDRAKKSLNFEEFGFDYLRKTGENISLLGHVFFLHCFFIVR